jgi:hypothetical protein
MDANFYDIFNANVDSSGNKTFAQWQAMGKDVNGKVGNPMFVNAATGDFRLQTNSPACGAGAFPCGTAASTVLPTASPTPTLSPSTPTATASPAPVLPTSTPTAATLPTISPATPTTAPVGMKSVDIRVVNGNNDVEESSSGQMNIYSTTLELVYESSTQKVGVRFMGVSIPQGATIVNAYVQFKAGNISSYSTNLSIQGDANANAQAFASTAQNISSRTRTTGIVNWSPSSWLKIGEAGPAQLTPNLAPIIQEIINKPDWYSGNSMVIIFTGSGLRTAKTYEGDAAGAPLLHIEYTTDKVVSNLSSPLLVETVSTELPATLPTTEISVSTLTATIQSPVPTIPVTFTSTVSPDPLTVTWTNTPIIPSATPSSVPTITASPIPVVPTFTPTSVPPTVAKSAGSEIVYDNKDRAFVYSAGWRDVSHKQAYQGSYKQTSSKDSNVTFTFTGQSFSILYKGGPAFRKMQVYVDNVLVETINQQAANPSFQLRWNYAGQLATGTHTLKLVFVPPDTTDTTNGSIDAVIVR